MTLVPLNDALSLSGLSDAALRVRAIAAARDYDSQTLCELTDAYLLTGSRQASRGSARTRQAYRLGVRTFVPWAQENGVQLLRPGRRDAGRFVAYLQSKPNNARGRSGRLSANTVAQYVAAARALYRALRWAGACEAQPFEDVSAPPDATPGIVRNPPYMAEVDAVLGVTDARLSALLLLCAHAGLRIGEALNLRGDDVRGARLTVRGKGGKTRLVPLGRRIRAALDAAPPLAQNRYFHWTYAQAAYRLRQAFRAAGYAHSWRGFHAARKHSGTRLYQATKDFTRVGLFLGHTSVDTTRRYVAVMDDDVAGEVEEF